MGVSKSDKDLSLHSALSAIHFWFSQNGLVINPDKSESPMATTAQQSRISPIGLSSIDVAGSIIPFSDNIKIPGVILGSHFNFNKHVSQICNSAHYHIRSFGHIRSSLTLDMAKTIAATLDGSRFEYVNAILYGISSANIRKLQTAHNSLAQTPVDLNTSLQFYSNSTGCQSATGSSSNWQLWFSRSF